MFSIFVQFSARYFTLLFIIPRTVLLSFIQPKAETLDFSTTHFREIFRKSTIHVKTSKGSVVKQSGNDVEGCRFGKGFVSTQYARISAAQCKMNASAFLQNHVVDRDPVISLSKSINQSINFFKISRVDFDV